jgi:hypothetical protein
MSREDRCFASDMLTVYREKPEVELRMKVATKCDSNPSEERDSCRMLLSRFLDSPGFATSEVELSLSQQIVHRESSEKFCQLLRHVAVARSNLNGACRLRVLLPRCHYHYWFAAHLQLLLSGSARHCSFHGSVPSVRLPTAASSGSLAGSTARIRSPRAMSRDATVPATIRLLRRLSSAHEPVLPVSPRSSCNRRSSINQQGFSSLCLTNGS